MAKKRRDQVLINKNLLLVLFALIIVLFILSACLLGVVVSDRRQDSSSEPPKVSDSSPSDSAPTGSVPAGSSLPPVSNPTAVNGTGSYTVNTTADALNVRGTPNSDGDVVTQIPKGTQISVTAVSGSWGYVTYNGQSGWVSMNYLVAVPQSSAPQTSVTVQN